MALGMGAGLGVHTIKLIGGENGDRRPRTGDRRPIGHDMSDCERISIANFECRILNVEY